MQSTVIARTETLCIEYFRGEGNRKLAFTFSYLGHRTVEGLGFAGHVLAEDGFDLVAFKSSRDYWFQDVRIRDLMEVQNAIARSGRTYDLRVGYGSSMGGYAAILFSQALDLDRALAVSPQFEIREAWDRRWQSHAREIDFSYRLSRHAISRTCEFTMIYDPIGADERQAREICALMIPAHVKLVPLPYSGHPSGHFLSELGVVRRFVLSILNHGQPAVPIGAIRRRKGESKTYLRTLALTCAGRNKARWSIDLIDRAIALDPSDGLLRALSAQIRARAGHFKAALRAARDAVEAAPQVPDYKLLLCELLAKAGHTALAADIADRAVAAHPGFAPLQSLRATLRDALGAAARAS
jgi:tetratricopeptide (TPR) repeat protein